MNPNTPHVIDACIQECAHRPAYTLATTVTVLARRGAESWEVVGRGADAEYARADAVIHAYGCLGDDVTIEEHRGDETHEEHGCPDCTCCTYCGPGPDNDCTFNERLGDSTCPCTCG